MGVDTAGKVYRLRGDASLEDVSDRYGLADKHVVAVVAMGERVRPLPTTGASRSPTAPRWSLGTTLDGKASPRVTYGWQAW